MNDRPQSEPARGGRTRLASAIEADLAYFDARLSLIGEHPASVYEQAQARAFTLLGRQLQAALTRARQRGGKPK
ncbi:MAG: hypothetical protein P8106_07915 [Gammaproteobacteria bacterium]